MERKSIENIPTLFSRYSPLLKEYAAHPILKHIVEEINNTMLNVRVKQILITLQHYEKKELEILLGLFEEKREALHSYIVPKLIHHIVTEIKD